MRIQIIADNYVARTDVLGEFGLSMWIETGGRRILFDTGQGFVFDQNLAALGLPKGPVDALVLSHGHYDHTGGLPSALRLLPPKAVFLHPYALVRKFTRLGAGPMRSIGMPEEAVEELNGFKDVIVWSRGLTEVSPGLWCTGEISRKWPSDPGAQPFYLDDGGLEADPLLDDQALFADTKDGLVVITGCAHAGVENTIEHILAVTGARKVHALIGGFHLGRASDDCLDRTAKVLERVSCQVLAPCHCTGMKAQAYLRSRFPGLVHDAGAGSGFVFG
jgi:7,8-dihydropterin-6-yl-methyl-4-(beta-D-ribofuranosyl)aminobenzene 5'-phosphate synthase